MLKYLTQFSLELHLTCIEMIEGTVGSTIKTALICGHYNKGLEFANFELTGLAHLLVISGAHLHYIDSCISRLSRQLRWPQATLSILFLGLFALIANGKPPVVRALFHSAYQSFNLKYSLHWPPPLVHLISGLTCLCLNPEWWQSSSLILSWLATLILSLPTSNPWTSVSLIYLAIFPFTWNWGYTPHPISIVLNLLISPLFFGSLLPLSFLSVIYPPLNGLYLGIWALFTKSLALFSDSFPGTAQKGGAFQLTYFWIYLFVLQWGAYWLHIQSKRSV